MVANDPLELVGEVIAEKYRVENVVGEGGFAIVYRAIHQIWNRPVALKVFKALDEVPPEMRDRLLKEFVQEGALLAELSEKSAAIVQARDVGMLTTKKSAVIPYMVLEWLEGRSLEAILEAERAQGAAPRTLLQAIALLQPVGQALSLAHDRGIAHRDVKPANVFVLGDPYAVQPSVKLLDFGIAKVVQDAQKMSGSFTKTSGQITSFTPAYGAPEQFSRDYGATGPWTDVFALALILVEVLTRREPLGGDTLTQLAFASVDANKRPTPRTLGCELPENVETVFQKALAVRPEQRFKTAGEFWAALESAARGEQWDLAMGRTALPGAESLSAISARSGVPSSARTGAGAPGEASMAPAPPAKSGKGALIAGVLVGIALFGGVGAFLVTRESSNGGPSTTPSGSAASVAPGPSASASASAAAVPKSGKCPPGMQYIEGGVFFMGSREAPGVPEAETPPHPVRLTPYCIDVTEVTVAKYIDCTKGKGCQRVDDAANNDWENITPEQKKIYDPLCNVRDPEKRAKHPVNCVTWDDAVTYCRAMNGMLPTEAQWEYAARGKEQYKFPWGDEADLAGRLNACGKECVAWGKKHDPKNFTDPMYDWDDGWVNTAEVGSFPKGQTKSSNLEDMSGNVFEWVEDVYEPYPMKEKGVPLDEVTDPHGPKFAKGKERGVRGGAWNSYQVFWLRPTYRWSRPPWYRTHGIGFRCASSPLP